MAKKIETRGRPKADSPKSEQVAFRVEADVAVALEKYRQRLNVTGLSASYAARDLIVKALKREGLL